jgi:hypothetical protein
MRALFCNNCSPARTLLKPSTPAIRAILRIYAGTSVALVLTAVLR